MSAVNKADIDHMYATGRDVAHTQITNQGQGYPEIEHGLYAKARNLFDAFWSGYKDELSERQSEVKKILQSARA